MPETAQDRVGAVGGRLKAASCTAENAWRGSLYALWGAQFTAIAAFSFVMPFIPFYVRELGVQETRQAALWAGVLLTGSGLMMALCSPVWGTLADRYGRKLMVERAMFSGAVVISLMGLVGNVYQLFALRVLQGALTGTVPASIALVSSFTPQDKRGYSLGLMQMAVFVGSALGPYVGGVLADHFGYRLTFPITGLLLLAAGAVVMFYVQEGRAEAGAREERPARVGIGEVLASRRFALLLGVFFFVSFANMVAAPVFALFVESLLPRKVAVATITGLLMALGGIMAGAGSLFIGRASDRLGHKPVLLVCLWLSGLACIGQGLVTRVGQLFAVRAMFGWAAGGTAPALNALVAATVPAEAFGRAYGLTSSANALGMALGPLLGGLVASWLGLRAPFVITGALLVALAAAIGLGVRRANHR
jgi:DHA1 family multidrug resistance protein-like MFS transporter